MSQVSDAVRRVTCGARLARPRRATIRGAPAVATVSRCSASQSETYADDIDEMLDMRHHKLATIGRCVAHGTTVGKMVERSLYHTKDPVMRHSRDRRLIGDHCSAGMIYSC